jgi:hypothetical protein
MPVQGASDKADENTLPDPELNPLLNPLLAAHMGRWAEVYFTNPPEKRGEAVAQLLRELQSISPPDPPPAPVLSDARERERENEHEEETVATAQAHPAAAATSTVPTCQVCGYHNGAEQNFCGMCGVPLQVIGEAPTFQTAEAEPIAAGSWCERSLGDHPVTDEIDLAVASSAANGRHDSATAIQMEPEKYLPDFGLEPEPAPNRYRVYVGVGLAILVTALVYMAWRSTQALSGSTAPRAIPAQTVPAAEPAAATSVPQASVSQASVPQPSVPQASASSPDPTTSATPPASPVQNQSQPVASSQEDQSGSRILPVTSGSSPQVPEQSGTEELAIAEKFLNGNQGTHRDSAEAAVWLWKAMGKGNLAATMALSDLYLRGDGVAKSCDQARVLLDAAARKGGKAAAERLRNLQAFGCQ